MLGGRKEKKTLSKGYNVLLYLSVKAGSSRGSYSFVKTSFSSSFSLPGDLGSSSCMKLQQKPSGNDPAAPWPVFPVPHVARCI